MQELSQNELEEFHFYLGRKVVPELCSHFKVIHMLQLERDEKRKAQSYTRRVWSKTDIHDYVARHARECAVHAASLLSDSPPMLRVYELTDSRGRRSATMGAVNFSTFAPYSSSPASLSLAIESTIVIRSIRLHPSLRRKGFLSSLKGELSQLGVRALVLENVVNPSWAYALYLKSLSSDTFILLSSPETVDFEHQLSPGPTFAVKL